MFQPSAYGVPKDNALRVGVLGGSFNPAHEGHLRMSIFALERLKLNEVWWLVSPQNPLKSGKETAPLEQRCERAAKLANIDPRISVTALEKTFGTAYTADTLAELKKRLPNTRFVWLMGEDNLQQIDKWRDWERIFTQVPVAVFRRKGYVGRCTAAERFASARAGIECSRDLADMNPPAWTILDNEFDDASSTEIRRTEGVFKSGD